MQLGDSAIGAQSAFTTSHPRFPGSDPVRGVRQPALSCAQRSPTAARQAAPKLPLLPLQSREVVPPAQGCREGETPGETSGFLPQVLGKLGAMKQGGWSRTSSELHPGQRHQPALGTALGRCCPSSSGWEPWEPHITDRDPEAHSSDQGGPGAKTAGKARQEHS